MELIKFSANIWLVFVEWAAMAILFLAAANIRSNKQVENYNSITRLLFVEHAGVLELDLARERIRQLLETEKQLTSLRSQLSKLQDESNQLRKENAQFAVQSAEANRMRQDVQSKLDKAGARISELVAARAEFQTAQEQANQKTLGLQSEKERLQRDNAQLQVAVAAARRNASELQSVVNTSAKKIAALESGMAQWEGGTIPQKLIGLRGRMDKVALMIDTSGSMTEDTARWEEAKQTLATWSRYLPVKQVVLLSFASDVRRFGSFQLRDQTGLVDDANMKRFTNTVSAVTFGGLTRLDLALSDAMNCKPDSILLFTDGEPNGGSELPNRELLRRIDQIVASAPAVPINVIGLGVYADSRKFIFLKELAQKTHGAFLGK